MNTHVYVNMYICLIESRKQKVHLRKDHIIYKCIFWLSPTKLRLLSHHSVMVSVQCVGSWFQYFLRNISVYLWNIFSNRLFHIYLQPHFSRFLFFAIHLFSQNFVCILKKQDSQSQLIFSHSPGVSRFLRSKIIFPEQSHMKIMYFYELRQPSSLPVLVISNTSCRCFRSCRIVRSRVHVWGRHGRYQTLKHRQVVHIFAGKSTISTSWSWSRDQFWLDEALLKFESPLELNVKLEW